MQKLIVALDVDSSVMTHGYPELGEDIGAIPWLLKAQALSTDVEYILCTMRDGREAEEAKKWLVDQGVMVTTINVHPTQKTWTTSPKPYYHLLVDDRSVGVPLRADRCIDWAVFGPQLIKAVTERLRKR